MCKNRLEAISLGFAAMALACAAHGALLYNLEGPIWPQGTAATKGPSMDADVIPEYLAGLTISAWIKPASFVGGPHEIFRIEDNSARVIFSFQGEGKRLAFGLSQPGYTELRMTDSADFAAQLTDGNWHFVCATADSPGYRRIWVDGAEVASGEIGEIRVARGKLGWVGSMGGGGEFFNGGMADVQVRDDCLDADAIRTAFGNGLLARGARWTWAGADGADWSAAANWTTGGVAAASAPVTACVAVVTAPASLALDADASCGALQLAGSGTASFSGATLTTYRLDIGAGAVLDIAAGTEIRAYAATRGGAPIPYGAYTGSGTGGHPVSWLSGEGVLRIAAPSADTFPTEIVAAGADGWCTFGRASGSAMGESQGWIAGKNHQYIKGDYVRFEQLAFPENAKLKLVGGVLADWLPAGRFSAVDVSGLKHLAVGHAVPHLADGSFFTVPSGGYMRYFPGDYSWSETSNCWFHTSLTKRPYAGDLTMNGEFTAMGNGNTYNPRVFTSWFGGGGTLRLSNFSNHIRFKGGFAFTGNVSGLQQGCSFWLDTTSVTGQMGTVTFGGISGKYSTSTSYSADGLLFGRNNSDETADHALEIKTLNSNGSEGTDANGKRWRLGGHVIVWGGNTVRVGTLQSGLHAVANRADQDCRNGFYNTTYPCKGTGDLAVDDFTGGTLYPSTNICVTVGKVTGARTFDYTFQSGAANGMTLDITNSCAATAVVKATDIGMLPARLSGFTGMVTLTDTATKAWTMPLDFTQGTNSLYNTVGCIGSGTLGSAPAAGSIDVTFPTTGDAPVKGQYALARFTSGGEKLAGWTVTLNGQAVTSAFAQGMEIKVVKDATGLWLDVDKPGLTITIR